SGAVRVAEVEPMKIRVAAPFMVAIAMLLASAAASAQELSLVQAAEAGDRASALESLDSGADPNAPGADGSTALLWAAYHGDAELAQRLIDAGADVDARNVFGTFALAEAAIIGSAPVIELLLDAGA